ncbi:MAG: hypothetical protein P4L92_22925 [Rudaea sp.]|nr:hypothetical protein [Rudaea sp.]
MPISTDRDPRKIIDGMKAQAEALQVLHVLRCQIKPWHSIRQVREMISAEFGLRATRCGMDPDIISDFDEHANDAFFSAQQATEAAA